MAETVHLELIGDVSGPIRGESVQTSLGRGDTIECVYWEQAVTISADPKSTTGVSPALGPFIFRKRIDKSSPLLLKLLCEKEKIKGVFRFYRPNPIGDGTTQQFYTVEFDQARIIKVRDLVLDTTDPATSSRLPLEEVTIAAQSISWTYPSTKDVYKATTASPTSI